MATYGISYLMQMDIGPPKVAMLAWTFYDLPLQLEKWRGEDMPLDSQNAEATRADVIANRIYRDDMEVMIPIYTAMYKDRSKGGYRVPMNCCRTNGWSIVKDVCKNNQVLDKLMISMAVTTWEKSGERDCLVVHWH